MNWGYNPLILTFDPNFLGHPSNGTLKLFEDTPTKFNSEFSPKKLVFGRRSFPIGKLTFQGLCKLQEGIYLVGRIKV